MVETRSLRQPVDETARGRAGRFHQSPMQRQGAAKRIDANFALPVRMKIEELNRGPEPRILNETTMARRKSRHPTTRPLRPNMGPDPHGELTRRPQGHRTPLTVQPPPGTMPAHTENQWQETP